MALTYIIHAFSNLKRYQDKEAIRAVKKARGKRVKYIPLKF